MEVDAGGQDTTYISWCEITSEQSQNTVLLASTQAVYKAPHSTVREQQ